MTSDEDFHQRVAGLVQREREALAPLASLPVVEVTGVTSATGAGALGDPRSDTWALRLVMDAWKLANGPLRQAPLFVRRVASEAEIDALVARCDGRAAVGLRGHLQHSGDEQPAILLLTEWLDGPVHDPDLTAALEQAEAVEVRAAAVFDAPSDLQDARGGRLAWDAALGCWSGATSWAGATVTLNLDASRDRDPQTLLAAAHALFETETTWQAAIRSVAEGELLKLYNDVWREDDERLEGSDFAGRLRLHTITVGPEGQLDFWLHDDGLFGEHDIRLSGQLDRAGLQHALVG